MISISYKGFMLLIDVYRFSFLNNLQIHDLSFAVIVRINIKSSYMSVCE